MSHTLVVVSDDDVFTLIQELLASDRRTLLHVPTGAAALRLFAEQRTPTIALIDLPLADMSAAELVESLRDDAELARLVATVFLAPPGVRVPTRAFRVVRKPSHPRDLLGAIGEARRQLTVWSDGAPATPPDRYLVWRSRRMRSALP